MVAGRVLVARFRNRLGDIDGVDSLRNQEAVCLGRVDLTWVAICNQRLHQLPYCCLCRIPARKGSEQSAGPWRQDC